MASKEGGISMISSDRRMSVPASYMAGVGLAGNPVARAVQRQRVMLATRNFSLRVHLLSDGERVAADAIAAAKVLAVAIGTLQLQGVTSGPAWRVMHGGMSTLLQLCERGFVWRVRDAVAIDMAIEHAAKALTSAPLALVQQAWVDSEAEHLQAAGVPA